jgi:hydrogen peroxide-dependent heme synthase
MSENNQAMPAVPLTLEGAAVLHQMYRLRWPEWRTRAAIERDYAAKEFGEVMGTLEKSGSSAMYSLFGHKGDVMLIHFRNDFHALKQAEVAFAKLRLNEFLEPTTSYVSVVELGLYESTGKTYSELSAKGAAPHSDEWNAGVKDVLARQSEAMKPRLWPEVPPAKYACFYPMDRKRGEAKNWYMLPLAERQRQMHEHGLVGRRYAGQVKQIISGSIGFDDWEWGVDLFADDPLVFKKLIYEMRFDQVSAEYALFGSFYFGMRCPAAELSALLNGDWPK